MRLLLFLALITGNDVVRVCKISKDNPLNREYVVTLQQRAVKFLIVGDWGGYPVLPYPTKIQDNVASGMGKIGQTVGANFVLSVGDNFYLFGVDSENDKHIKKTFENVYTATSLSVPWYTIAGNHDHYGNVDAQIRYTKLSARWKFPDYYYSIRHRLSSGVGVDIIGIDTIILCGNAKSDFNISNGFSSDIKGPSDRAAANAQWSWLENQLNSTKANYVFVMGHYPLWSVGAHGPTKCLIDQLDPMLAKYKVNAYFMGHDHNLQHLQTDRTSAGKSWTTHYVLSGAGAYEHAQQLHLKDVPANSNKFFYPPSSGTFLSTLCGKAGYCGEGGFVSVELDEKRANFTFWKGSGEEKVYEFSMLPRK